MRTEILSKLTLAALLVSLGCRPLRAQPNAAADSGAPATPLDAEVAAQAPDIIFSNLTPDPRDRYNSDPYLAFPIVGKKVRAETESWYAVAFTPQSDAQAMMLLAAVKYVSGTKLVTLGIYSDNDGTVGTLLPGGQGHTTRIPELDDCCQLTKVTLSGDGVKLVRGTRYWLVAGPDDVNGPTFQGAWQLSHFSAYAAVTPPSSWDTPSGQWPAAQVRGTKLQEGVMQQADKRFSYSEESPANTVIFSNLQRPATERYLAGVGILITGNNVPLEPEIWEALPFTPRVDAHAQTLSAAIGYVSGTKKVNLGIYSDSDGSVGTLLAGGQGSTADIPDFGDCCELTTVRLPGSGVALTAGVQYWLVASPDNVTAPDFEGKWQDSDLALAAYEQPKHGINWTSFSAGWLAAEIRGAKP